MTKIDKVKKYIAHKTKKMSSMDSTRKPVANPGARKGFR
jgi:hypothetical protein